VRLRAFVLLLAAALVACAGGPRVERAAPADVVFLSDFGSVDDAVAICKGVMFAVAPRLRVVDLTHDVPPFSIRDGARLLAGPTAYYPPGTVFLAVVDPGVGAARRALVARSRRGQFFVVPDNGLLTAVAERDGLEGVREITNESWMRGPSTSATFHGRDIFAPVAARLAAGGDWREVGPVVADPAGIDVPVVARVPEGIRGEVVALDGRFGNLLTNVGATDFAALGHAAGDRVAVRIGARELRLRFVHTFAEVPVGEPLLYVDSRGNIALAVNRGSFAERFGVAVPAPLLIRGKEG
jgi:S-adenosyl-L-methionine hydrolase (adenosine-forming)